MRTRSILAGVAGAALVAAAIGACHGRDTAIAERAQLELRLKQNTDSIATLRTELAAAEHATDTVRQTVTRLLVAANVDTSWRTDTLRVPGDPAPRLAIPVVAVVRQDSLNRACTDLVSSCTLERQRHAQLEATQASRIAMLEARPDRSCKGAFLAGTALGGIGGALLEHHLTATSDPGARAAPRGVRIPLGRIALAL